MTSTTDEVIAVYTMGKVASTSISQSLKRSGISCYDVHSLAPDRYLSILRSIGTNPDLVAKAVQRRWFFGTHVSERQVVVPAHLIDSLAVMQAIIDQRPLKIISLIREPIGRNISAVFQNLPKRLLKDPEAVLTRLRNYSINLPDNWFDRDFRAVTGIDALNMEHDRSADQFRLASEGFDVLIMKMDIPDERKSTILSDFIGRSVTVERANEARAKDYYEMYKRLLAEPCSIRSDFVGDCFNLRYFRAFFSDEERQAVARKFGYAGSV